MSTEEQLREALQELLEANEDCEKTYNPWASIAAMSRARDRYASAVKQGKATLSQEPVGSRGAGGGEAVNIERKVYKSSPEYSEYLRARFDQKHRTGISFEWGGHRWTYRFTSFDDAGEYELLWRPTPPASQEQADDTLRCIDARNKLNTAIYGNGAVIDDLETAVHQATLIIKRHRARETNAKEN